jgi:Zn-dependent alcohol dehydrogenase
VDPDVLIPRLVRLVSQGKMRLSGLFTHTFPLVSVNEAIQALRQGTAGRVLLRT